MSLLPVKLNVVNDTFAKTCGPNGKPYDFGSGVHGVDLHLHHERRNSGIMEWLGYNRPSTVRRKSSEKGAGEKSPVISPTIAQVTSSNSSHIGKDGFQVFLDVEHFAPAEITVKTIENTIVIEGKHEEREDEHGDIYRHFIRRYQLSKECDVTQVLATLTSDGILSIKAPLGCGPIEGDDNTSSAPQKVEKMSE